ncbi:MAG: Gfo/Idh/MocA family protein [Imperialibacter sp.]|uniref:Gfo/Idh/MocA family protein n=1 Tax=Imperialibacter sp. TaxID=2038411 RepID=UPI003A85C0FA
MPTNNERREFIKKTALGTVGLSFAMSARSYGSILGANDRVNFAVVGANSRGRAHISAISKVNNASLGYLCDVDSRVFDSAGAHIEKAMGKKAKTEKDFRKLLENKYVDAITIATPEHWHAPMGIMGANAGKHVYIEKPCSHNPNETGMLVASQKKNKIVMQMGNQQRSGLASKEAMSDIRNGIIGKAYACKAWYANARKSIGVGKPAPVPEWLDWELWQGPAPRKEYKDNVVHYNWHWFKHWGTGELHNNGTHEIDISRWALGVDYPTKVSSSGGRYAFQDDWEYYDTQMVNYEFEGGKMITWEGRSCNGFDVYNRGRGVTIHGTEGTILLDRNSYQLFDMSGKLVKEVKEGAESATTNTMGEGILDVYHFNNFADAIREGKTLNAPIADASISTQLCHFGNISQETGRTLNIDPAKGQILNDKDALKNWSREYQKGWAPVV